MRPIIREPFGSRYAAERFQGWHTGSLCDATSDERHMHFIASRVNVINHALCFGASTWQQLFLILKTQTCTLCAQLTSLLCPPQQCDQMII
jgi:hypothetical protein